MYEKMLAHVLGHNFAPLAFRVEAWTPGRTDGHLHIYLGFGALEAVWKGPDFTETNDIGDGVRAFIRRNAAAYGDEVSAPPEPVSYGF